MFYIYIELDVEGLMQCAREAETSCDRPATPIPAWTSDTQVYITPIVLCSTELPEFFTFTSFAISYLSCKFLS